MGSGRVAAATSIALQTKDDATSPSTGSASCAWATWSPCASGMRALHRLPRRWNHRRRRRPATAPRRATAQAVTILLSAGDGSLRPRVDPAANLASMLGLPVRRPRPTSPPRRCSRRAASPSTSRVGGGLRRSRAARPETLQGRRRCVARHRARRDGGAGGRERLRQEHLWAARCSGSSRRPPARSSTTASTSSATTRAPRASCAPRSGGLPGPVLLAEPDHDRAADAGEVLKVHRLCPPGGAAGARRRAARDGRPLAGDGRPQAAPVQRRPAPAHRHRPRPRRRARNSSWPTRRSRRSTSRCRRRCST